MGGRGRYLELVTNVHITQSLNSTAIVLYKIMLHVIVLHKINPNTYNTNRTYELLLLSHRGAEREKLGKVRKLNPGHCSNDCSSVFVVRRRRMREFKRWL